MPGTFRLKKKRLDHLLTERGLAESGAQAQRLVMAGLVYVNGQKCDKPGTSVHSDAEIEVREKLRYVSRGGLKLEGALAHFPFDAQGAVCLDVGASTGGFTDCLLQQGAVKVYAVDVGRRQLHYRLRQDGRVVNLERIHIRDLSRLQVPNDVDALTIDVSFISLTKVLPMAWKFLRSGGWCVALIKPQFEAERKQVGKGGVIRDEHVRRACVDKVTALAGTLEGAEVLGVIESPIHGPKGNVEFLLALRKAGSGYPPA